jgi:3' terminal RNA ribose 2'-O-methyltransferase Hen1
MLLTLSLAGPHAPDLSYLLHKNPSRFQSFDLSFGQAHLFYPEASPERTTACLLLSVDPVGMVRGKGAAQRYGLDHYVNDRPYAASSFLSVAISQVLGTALGGRCADRPDLVATPLPLTASLETLPVRGGERFLRGVFEPLGYTIEAERHALDEQFPEWGESPYYRVTIGKRTTLSELLTHLYVLVPVFDNQKHYYVGQAELDKLLAKGEGWLAGHPLKEEIAKRYLRNQRGLYREALSRLALEDATEDDEAPSATDAEEQLERPVSLNEQRHGAVLAALRESGAKRVLDLGCGEGKLLASLVRDRQFESIVGVDVSTARLKIAEERLHLDRRPNERVRLLQGSLMYRDARFAGFDAAAVVEVIEHLDPPRLAAFERVLFEFARPRAIVITTPNREYNSQWETLPAGKFRHADHRFEWTRAEFHAWAERIAARFGYAVRFLPIGPIHEQLGPPTQMGVFAITNSAST